MQNSYMIPESIGIELVSLLGMRRQGAMVRTRCALTMRCAIAVGRTAGFHHPFATRLKDSEPPHCLPVPLSHFIGLRCMSDSTAKRPGFRTEYFKVPLVRVPGKRRSHPGPTVKEPPRVRSLTVADSPQASSQCTSHPTSATSSSRPPTRLEG